MMTQSTPPSAQTVETAHATNTLHPITIEKLVYGGDGLGRLASGEIVFVPYAAPGDSGTISLQPQVGKKPKKGIWKELPQPSPLRDTPKCSVYGQCGGCHWQHINANEHANLKLAIFEETCRRLGKLNSIPTSVLLPKNADSWAWQYRLRCQWHLTNGVLGFHAADSHQVISFDTCELLHPTLQAVYEALLAHLPQLAGCTRIEARVSDRRLDSHSLDAPDPWQLILSAAQPQAVPMAKACQTDGPPAWLPPGLASIVLVNTTTEQASSVFGDEYLTQVMGDVAFQVHATSFCQVNRAASEALLDVLQTHCMPAPASIIDLYAGIGLWGLSLSPRVTESVTLLESSPYATQDAHDNALSFDNKTSADITVMEGNLDETLATFDEVADVVIVDPPRSGLSKTVMRWLVNHPPKQCFYLSCDPTTLARDLALLVNDHGWTIQQAWISDMFPQTYHMESLVLLTPAQLV